MSENASERVAVSKPYYGIFFFVFMLSCTLCLAALGIFCLATIKEEFNKSNIIYCFITESGFMAFMVWGIVAAKQAFRAICSTTIDESGITQRHSVTKRTIRFPWSQIVDYRHGGGVLVAEDKTEITLLRTKVGGDTNLHFHRMLMEKLKPLLLIKARKAINEKQLVFKSGLGSKFVIEPKKGTICYRSKIFDLKDLQRAEISPPRRAAYCVLTFGNGELAMDPLRDMDLFLGVLRALAPNAAFAGVSGRIPMEDTELPPEISKKEELKEAANALWSSPILLSCLPLMLFALAMTSILLYLRNEIDMPRLRVTLLCFGIPAIILWFRSGMVLKRWLTLALSIAIGIIVWIESYSASLSATVNAIRGEFPIVFPMENIWRNTILAALGAAAVAALISEAGKLTASYLKRHKATKTH